MVSQNTTIKDAVCPECFEPLVGPTVNVHAEANKMPLRTYFAWCFKCDKGFEVIQFERAGRWVIHKYHQYAVGGIGDKPRPVGEWQVLNDVPDVPLVKTGPGGDYVNEITGKQVDEATERILQAAHNILSKTAQAISLLLSAYKANDENS